ncbi:hypothetical protein [Kordiimonas aquimaris]|uniref:hypothetical protein n=1 Tax=Kordiimonas aquimaris TaxID=707591 RepID=UPI0021CEA236|nr:hypothetical protein [Kordiimonas aquimaris]
MTEDTEVTLPDFSPHRPILLVDADEVLLKFIQHLELHLESEGYVLNLETFQLAGNIREIENQAAADQETVKYLIASFFDKHVDTVPAIDHAAEALQQLSTVFQIAVLTNIPHKHRVRRQNNLHSHGFNYPVIANSGGKGPTIKKIQQETSQTIVFVDDLPPQLSSVATHAPDTYLVHFVGDPRLAKLINKAPDAHVRIDDWRELKAHLIDYIK